MPPPTLTLPMLLLRRAREISNFFLIAARSRSRSTFACWSTFISSPSESPASAATCALLVSTTLILTRLALVPSVSSTSAAATSERLVPGVTTLDMRLARALDGPIGRLGAPPNTSDLRFLLGSLAGDTAFRLAYHAPSPSILSNSRSCARSNFLVTPVHSLSCSTGPATGAGRLWRRSSPSASEVPVRPRRLFISARTDSAAEWNCVLEILWAGEPKRKGCVGGRESADDAGCVEGVLIDWEKAPGRMGSILESMGRLGYIEGHTGSLGRDSVYAMC